MGDASVTALGRINVLIVDGEDRDADLTLSELRGSMPDVSIRVAASKAELLDALATFEADVLLCDLAERNADRIDALGIVATLRLDLPVILVSSAIGERGVVAALRGGAVDYVLKANLLRLPSSVEHAVREHRESSRLQMLLRAAELRLAAHARRLETIARIANDPALHGTDWMAAILREAAASLRAPQRFRGFLNRMEGAELVVVAVTTEGDDDNAGAATFPVGYRLPILDTSAPVAARTQFWDATTTSELPAAAVAIGWQSEITTRFAAAGARYMLTFGAAVPTQFGPEDVAYVEVLADAFAHQIVTQRFEAALRESEERARGHAARLETLWRIANDSALSGEALWSAMLCEASRAIRPGQEFEGIFMHVDGTTVVRDAALAPGSHASVALVDSVLESLLAEGGGTRSWSDVVACGVRWPLARTRGWRAAIATAFPVLGTTYGLVFASREVAREPFGSLEHAYLDILASFFARSVGEARGLMAAAEHERTRRK